MGKEKSDAPQQEKMPPTTQDLQRQAVDKQSGPTQQGGQPEPKQAVQRMSNPSLPTAERDRVARALDGSMGSAWVNRMLRGPVQRQVEINVPGDLHEREAEAAANKAAGGGTVEPSSISGMGAGEQVQAAPAETGEKKPVQKADAPQQKVEDKKPVQRADAPQQKVEDKKPVQKADAPQQKVEDKKPVQKADAPQQKVEDKKPVQRAEVTAPPGVGADQKPVQMDKGTGAKAEEPTMHEAAEKAIESKGPGRPMNPSTRSDLESSTGADLSGVRVHDDDAAQKAASRLDARAFTHGSDIWLGRGESDSDKRLMAHETTHVIQQRGGLQRMVQRAKDKPAPSPSPANAPGGKPEIKIPLINIPPYKFSRHGSAYTNVFLQDRGETNQRSKWDTDVRSSVRTKVNEKLKDAQYVPQKSGKNQYYLKSKTGKVYLFGTITDIVNESLRPYWDGRGNERFFEVDHMKERQLGGDDDPTNYELLDAKANGLSGVYIQKEIQARVDDAMKTNFPQDQAKQKGKDGSYSIPDLRSKYTITVEKVDGKLKVPTEALMRGAVYYWSLKAVKAGEHLDLMRPMTIAEVEQEGLRGSPTELVIFSSKAGGFPRRIPWKADGAGLQKKDTGGSPVPPGGGGKNGEVPYIKKDFYEGYDLYAVSFSDPSQQEGATVGKLHGYGFNWDKKKKEKKSQKTGEKKDKYLELPFKASPGISYGGYIDDTTLKGKIAEALPEFPDFSPIVFTEARIDSKLGIVAVGQILPTIPLFEKIGIDLVVEGNNFRVRKLFSGSELKLPGPVTITGSNLELSGGNEGLKVQGDAFFEIEKVGQGFIGASAKTGLGDVEAGFAVAGEFVFDKRLFSGDAKIKAWYKEDKFGAEGELTIKEGKVKGIKEAQIKARYEEGTLEASGDAKLSVPGLKEGSLKLKASEKEGFAIGGSFELADNIPGIKGGTVEAEVKQKPEGDGYDLKASGKAQPKIPGVNAELAVAYENGLFTVEGTAAYEKGMLKGSVQVGATNRKVDDKGQPSGEPGPKLTAYGGGTVIIRVAPWLQGTVAVLLKPNGEMVVTGEVGLPDALDIFPEKRLDKNLLKIGLDIPIVGVAVAGQRIGIFANITGGIDLSAGIGPAQLRELGLKVQYNPDHEDQTRISGGAKLVVPASAGVRLFVRGGIGVGIPVVSAQAGLEMGGSLGLEGAISAGVSVEWMPNKGLSLDAAGEVFVEPKLKFDITGFVLVEADLWVKTIELYSKKWQLANFEYGSGLRLGMKFPVRYQEGKPFEISLSDVQFQTPDIQPKEVLSDLIKKIG